MSQNHDKYSIDNTDYQVGQDNIQKWGFDVHNPVFGISGGLVLLFLTIVLVMDPAEAKAGLDGIKWGIIGMFDSTLIWFANLLLIFCLVLAFSPYGKVRLGGSDARPDYSTPSWLAMLFSAGIGIGLLFWGVAEPVAYFTGWYETPLGVEAYSAEAAAVALGATIYHWGFHAWAMYAVVAVSLAFFAYNKGLPMSIRSIFYPILGDKTWGWAGHVIDILAVLATLFGLATSLGLGAQQAASGMHHVFGWDKGTGSQLLVIVLVTSLAIVSVVRGMEGGVKLLSNINMVMAVILLLVVAALGFSAVTTYLPEILIGYAENIIPLSNPHGREDETWMQGWTVFYWTWWISWSPFVGMFIARVSRGRTIREFLLVVLVIPTLMILLWMGVFGGIALEQIANGVGALAADGLKEVPLATYQMYDELPMGHILSMVSILLVLVFFITSSDSGSLVIDSITAGGKIDAPVPQRVFWASMEGAVAAVLLWVGGTEAMQALQAGAVSTGLPFTFIILLMCVSLVMGLRTERR